MSLRDHCRGPAATIGSHESLREAARRMERDGLESLIVEADGKPTGVVTARDLVLESLCVGLSADAGRVEQVAKTPLVTIAETASLEDAGRMMRRNGSRRLPVVDAGGAIVGTLTADDLAELVTGQLAGVGAALGAQQASGGSPS